jgi:hypothetical protein
VVVLTNEVEKVTAAASDIDEGAGFLRKVGVDPGKEFRVRVSKSILVSLVEVFRGVSFVRHVFRIAECVGAIQTSIDICFGVRIRKRGRHSENRAGKRTQVHVPPKLT